jgi:hypothetical protein
MHSIDSEVGVGAGRSSSRASVEGVSNRGRAVAEGTDRPEGWRNNDRGEKEEARGETDTGAGEAGTRSIRTRNKTPSTRQIDERSKFRVRRAAEREQTNARIAATTPATHTQAYDTIIRSSHEPAAARCRVRLTWMRSRGDGVLIRSRCGVCRSCSVGAGD